MLAGVKRATALRDPQKDDETIEDSARSFQAGDTTWRRAVQV
jgi:hypothetical protein